MFVQLIHFPSPQITKIFKKVKAEHEAKHLIPSERRALCAVLCHPHRSSPAWGITLNIRVHPGQSPLPSCSFHSTELPCQPALQSCAAAWFRLPWLYQAGSPADFFRTKPQSIFPWRNACLLMHALPERVPAVLSNIPLWWAHPCICHKLCCLTLLGSNLMFSNGKRFGFKNKRDS